MTGHLPCRDTFAWIQKCPFKAGTTVGHMNSGKPANDLDEVHTCRICGGPMLGKTATSSGG